MKEKIAVYTCITGNYDELKEIDKTLLEKDIDYYCFTNNKNIKSKSWKIIYIEDFNLSNYMLNRKIKILGHELINNNYDILVWLDGSIMIKQKITKFLKEQCNLEEYSFCAFKHSERNCIYDEAIACVKLKKDSKDIITKQLDFYKKEKYPKNYGLCEMGVFVKKQKDEKVLETMKLWYEMINKYSKRDQLSFMWCVKKNELKLEILPLSLYDNPYFSVCPHFIEKNKIADYRLYFGDSSKFEIERVIDGTYEKNGDTYIVKNIIVPIDTTKIEFYVCDISGVEFSDFKINDEEQKNAIFYNFTYINNKTYFFNNSSKIVIEGNFKKDEKLTLSICLKIISLDKWIEIAHDCEIKGNNLLQKNKQLESQIANQELTIATQKQTITTQKQQLSNLKMELDKIVSSKGWKLLENLRKIKYRNK